MIGVIARPSEQQIVTEFFELFKTPWEVYRRGRRYDVVLCSGDTAADINCAKLVIVYFSRPLSGGERADFPKVAKDKGEHVLSWRGWRIPIYGDCLHFQQRPNDFLVDEETGKAAACIDISGACTRARIGYDLFSEIGTLLTIGQPVAYAAIPTLELHIALLRHLILSAGVPLVEIPPIPDGHAFIACLTHDVDHPSIRRHKGDHTMFGFLYRAVLGSLLDVFRRRISVSSMATNWAAVLKLPLVYLGLADDFWHRFQEYPKLEKGAPSSFFVIPFEGRPGESACGPAPHRRAAAYGAADIARQIRNLISAGCEIGLHGIDAWRDSSQGRKELEEIRRVTCAREVGVRMHWLYFDELSPAHLEEAGATYDSTVGYNDAIGYRAGTTQVYRLLQATRLLELPLHIMDTALFYPRRLHLSAREARKHVDRVVFLTGQFGGTVTVNWHDRSIAPERQWGRFYEDMVNDLGGKGAWFSTAGQAVAWFQKRRSAVFESTGWESDTLTLKIAVQENDVVPPLQLRIYKPWSSGRDTAPNRSLWRSDITMRLNSNMEARISLTAFDETSLQRENGWVTANIG